MPSRKSATKPKKRKPIPPRLDFSSEEFDALAALRSRDVVLPFPKIAALDNISQCRQLILTEYIDLVKRQQVQQHALAEEAAKVVVQNNAWSGTVVEDLEIADDARNPLMHDVSKMKAKAQRDKERNVSRQYDLLDYSDKKFLSGPISLLRDSFEAKTRVKVTVRRQRGERGTCEGFLEAFDKHYNLVLRDVTEEYRITERRYETNATDEQMQKELYRQALRRKIMACGGWTGEDGESDEGDDYGGTWIYDKIPVKRHVDRLFIRGDVVVLVQKTLADVARPPS